MNESRLFIYTDEQINEEKDIFKWISIVIFCKRKWRDTIARNEQTTGKD